jgi:hypothetical protein
MAVATEQQVRKPHALVRVSVEFAVLALSVTAITTWFITQFPSVVVNLRETVSAFGDDATNSVRLTWTASGDDGMIGQATTYDIRYSTQQLDETTWESATHVADEPLPQTAGATESFIVRGLQPNTTYSFAVKTQDEGGNWSAISNIATKKTSCTMAWSCSGWSACENGTQTRTCTDLNQCASDEGRPTETQTCATTPEEPPVGGEQLTLPESFIVIGPNKGSEPKVQIRRADGTLFSEFFAYTKRFRGGVRVAVGDLGSDGIDEIVVGPGPGMEPMVKVFSSKGTLITKFLAYNASFRGGVNVAIGNLDGKGANEIITIPASRGGSNVRMFGFRNGKYEPVIVNYFAFPRQYSGKWNIAVADLDGNTKSEIIVVPGEGTGGPYVKIFEYRGNRMRENMLGTMVFAKSFRGGVALAAGDVTYDGKDEYIVAVRSGDQALVRIFNAAGRTIIHQFTALPAENRNGIASLGVGHFTTPQE